MELQVFVTDFLSFIPLMIGAAPVIATIIDIAKRFGLKDGYAPLVSSVLNAGAYALYYFADDRRADVDNVLSGINLLAPYVAGLFVSLLSTNWAHNVLAKAGIGYHQKKAKAVEAQAQPAKK